VNINLIKQKTNMDKDIEKLDHSNHKKSKIIEEKKEKESQNKEEELSIKKKNTNSNTNDDDKSMSEVIFSSEVEQNLKKNIFQNDFNYLYDFKKDNEDINDDPNTFSKNNEMNKLNQVKGHKEKKIAKNLFLFILLI
jgi:mRNA-degrading endonuclease RelE of RelBE toxin-antitoxin system